MIALLPQVESYSASLGRWTRALAAGQAGGLEDALAVGSSLRDVEMFLESLHSKRIEKLLWQLRFVAGAFDDFEGLLVDSIRSVPPPPYDVGCGDAERLLGWLESAGELTAEQRDHVAHQRARHAVEESARRDRRRYLGFHELRSHSERLQGNLGADPGPILHLNPARAWCRLMTRALLDPDGPSPVDTLSFTACHPGGATAFIRTVEVVPTQLGPLRALESVAPCTLWQWMDRAGISQGGHLVELCRQLVRLGLLALSTENVPNRLSL
jgi:hypothetical protein